MDVREKYGMTDLELVEKLLQADKEKVFVAVQIMPAVRVLLGERFGFARGEDSLCKIASALRMMGADAVLDAGIAQDALILQWAKAVRESKEKGNGSVVVGKGVQAVSPMEICARMTKKYYGAKADGKSVRVVSVGCCAGAKRKVAGADVVLTVDELAELLDATGLNVRLLKKSALDTPFGVASGAAYICASAGGKAEAVARCLMENKSRAAAQKLAYSGLYGKGAVREAVIEGEGESWKFAVVPCAEEAKKIVADVENGVCAYDFVELTGGGCIAHGLENCEDAEMTLKLRGLGLRYIDRARAARSADVNPYAKIFLKEWEAMVRSGEAFAEIAAIDEDELVPAPVVEEVVEEIVEEIVEEPVVEEVIETLVVEEAIEEPVVEETVEEIAVAEAPVEEVVEEVVEAPVEEVVEEVVETPVEEVVEEVVEASVEEVIEEVAEAPVEEVVEEVAEAPVEEVVEEVVETPVEEVVEEVVEAPVEEVVEEVVETPVEEVVEEVAEAPVEEVVEEVVETPVEEVVEEVVETPVEEVVEEVVETPVEEVVEEVVETPVEEVVEEVAEAPVEEVVEEVAEAPVEEVIEKVEEAPVEDDDEEALAKRDPYYRRLSTKQRRKLKRQNKSQ